MLFNVFFSRVEAGSVSLGRSTFCCSLLLNPNSLSFFHILNKIHSELDFSAVSQEAIRVENRPPPPELGIELCSFDIMFNDSVRKVVHVHYHKGRKITVAAYNV